MRRTGAAISDPLPHGGCRTNAARAQERRPERRHSMGSPVMSADPSAPHATPLWVTLRGAPARRIAQWIAWAAVAIAAASAARGALGPGGVVVGILTGGWWLARRCSTPLDWTRRYHLDDDEVLALGPWRRVQRITWVQ